MTSAPPPASTGPKRRSPRQSTSAVLQAIRELLAAETLTRFSTTEVVALLRICPKRAAAALAELEESGEVRRVADRRAQWQASPVGGPPQDKVGGRPSIEELRQLAADRQVPDDAPIGRPGRLTASARAARQTLTAGQVGVVNMALNHACRLLQVHERAPLPSELLVYEGGTRNWTLAARVRTLYRRERAGHKADTQTPASFKAAEARIAMGISAVLDLAQAHGMIRGDQAAKGFLPTAWVEWVETNRRNTGARRHGLSQVAWAAVELGYLSPETVDWSTAVAALFGPARGPASESRRGAGITAAKRLGLAGLLPGTQAQRLVAGASSKAIREAARGDWDRWKTDLNEPLADAVLDGPYGLRRWVIWLSSNDRLTLDAEGLPPRERESQGGQGWKSFPALEPVSVQNLLRGMSIIIPAFVNAPGASKRPALSVRGMVSREGARAVASLSSGASRRAAVAALCSIAHFLACVGRFTGDTELAKEAAERARALQGAVTDELMESNRRRVELTVTGWGGNPTTAWANVCRLRERLTESVSEAAGCHLVGQLEALEAGSVAWTSGSWALAVRDALLLSMALRIPLRSRTMAGLRLWVAPDPQLAQRTSVLVGDAPAGGPFRGAVRLDCPPKACKSKRSFHPWLLNQIAQGEEPAEAANCRLLLNLYLHPNGARAVLLGAGGADEGWLWVGQGGDSLKNPSSSFKAGVTKFAASLGIHPEYLTDNHVAGLHSIRHLYGSEKAPKNIAVASAMLHHSNVLITQRYYCAFSERDINPDSV